MTRSTDRPRSSHAAEGFTYLGLMVVIAIVNIGLGVAVTSWGVIGKRAKETELIWRGQQYVRALGCHREQTGGPPEKLDDLLESDCIRALYPEPMNPDRGWRIIRESDLRAQGGGFGASASASATGLSPAEEMLDRLASFGRPGMGGGTGTRGGPGSSGPAPGQSSENQPRIMNAGPEIAERLQGRLQELTDRLRQNSAAGSGNGIVGVASFSPDESLRLYEGENTYDAWRFVAR